MAPRGPTEFEQAFLDDLPYDPEVLLFDRLLEVDREQSLVRCRMATRADLPLTRSQRIHPVVHPRHINGGLILHATGMLGFVHAYHVLDLRFADGWVGYGTHVHRGIFRRMILPGDAVQASCQATRARMGKDRHFIRYRLEFRSDEGLCYEGDQSAVWVRSDRGSVEASTEQGVRPRVF
ncbi:MAG: hypothetical protein JRI23_06945 [Deltaproteobacteria bacterium]|nr:hypothetical protein [Deltaproteobacteria bacterium]MBW2531324.1 hypothetical protein [Deltaproteobacteria bacterium]